VDETTRRRLRFAARALLRGFLLLVALVALLAVFTPLFCFHSPGKARVAAARHDVANVAFAVNLFRLDVGRDPTTEEGLAVLVTPTPQLEAEGRYRKGGYLDRLVTDPWGHPYHYKQPGCRNRAGYDVWSYGMDNAPGGEGEAADIGNWEPAHWDAGHRQVYALAAIPGALTGLAIGLPFYIGGAIFRRGQRMPHTQALRGMHLAALLYMIGVGTLITVLFAVFE
jgi:general secretion pathway protein G